MSLADKVAEHVASGCTNVDRSLGIHKMPEGYALMLDADETYFYWLAADGRESDIHWDKWAVWRGAKKAALRASGILEEGEKG